jgi:20S proteasome subunit alpha 3
MEGADPTIPDIQQALRLAVKVLNKTMDGTGAAVAEKMELFTMTLDAETGQVVHHILTKAETAAVVEALEQEAASAGDS